MVNEELKYYIEKNIFPIYRKNDLGHGIDHINYVIDRSLMFASDIDGINYDMVYTIAAYHDIGHFMDPKNHEKISSIYLLRDYNLREFFNENEIKIMSEAVYDHRSSLEYEPRSIYGKIVSSADRNTSLDTMLVRTYEYRVKHNPDYTIDEIIEESRKHIKEKFGKNGYATKKMYFEDLEYKDFLEEVKLIVDDKEEFKRRFCEANEITLIDGIGYIKTKKYN